MKPQTHDQFLGLKSNRYTEKRCEKLTSGQAVERVTFTVLYSAETNCDSIRLKIK